MPPLPSMWWGDRDAVDQLALGVAVGIEPLPVDTAEVGVADFMAVDFDFHAEVSGGRVTGGHVDHDAVQPFADALLGGANRGQDRGLGGIHVDDRASADPAGRVMPDAQHPHVPEGA